MWGAVWVSSAAQAQEAQPIILIADSVYLQGDSILTARGNIEAISGEIVLTATAIVYNALNDTITIEGPIELRDGTTTEIFAEFAELDSDFQNGLIQSARMVLDQQVELRAEEIRRVNGTVSELDDVRVTSCQTCETGEAPLWYIRAKKVTHDAEKKQLFLDEAQLRVFDLPVFYLPRLRLPDPTVERASGFLIPSFQQRSRIGLAAKVPYFIAMGDHRDLTLTPYLSRNMTTLEARYRQAFQTGEIALNGAVTTDNFSGFDTRAYLFAVGQFDLARDYKLTFDAKFTSDQAYLLDYDYSSLDRLNSEFALSRADRDRNSKFAFNHFRSLRATEDNQTLPAYVLSARHEQRFFPNAIGGEGLWELEFHAHARESQVDTDANLDGIVDGRDVTRLNAELGWRDRWWTTAGIQLGFEGNLAVDAIYTSEDSSITEERYVELTPSAAASMRYPMLRHTASGATQILEPIVQLGWSGGTMRSGTSDAVANDESTRSEFDEGNLLSLSRFSSDDRRERGTSLAYGVNWSHFGNTWDAGLTFGQIQYSETQEAFTLSSGLKGLSSDILVAGHLTHENGLRFNGRALLDSSLSLTKAEATGSWENNRFGLDASYVWLGEDSEEGRDEILAEWTLDTKYRLTRHWTGLANWRFDVASNSTTQAGLGLEYQNECVKAQFSVSRRYTSSTSVQPATDISFTIELLGFSARTRDKSYSRVCNQGAG